MLACYDMEPIANARRSRINLALGLCIGIALCVLNIGVNFPEYFANLFSIPARFPQVRTALNLLFVWLALLLGLAYFRWRQAEQRRAHLEGVISGISPDALCVVDPARRIVLCNPSVRRLFGYGEAELLGKPIDLLYFDCQQRMKDPRASYHDLQDQGYSIGIATGRRCSGELFPLEVICGDIPAGKGTVLLLRDITDRVREQEARREAELRMKDREHLESLGVLAGGVAHDFNNLLAGILGNAELALSDLDKPENLRQNLDRIMKNCDRAALVCRDLQAYAGKGKRRVERFGLTEVVLAEQSRLAAPGEAEAADLEASRLFYQLADDSQTLLQGDARQLRQLVRNLVTNALEAIQGRERGRVEITTSSSPFSRELFKGIIGDDLPDEAGRFVLLTVADNGPGMDRETLQHLFSPFFSTKFPGRGLGLCSTQGIVRSHGGWIKIETDPDQGTRIAVILPAAVQTQDAAATPT